ncbi:MAG: ABC transporter permease [Betaproteobacteria bacterium]|nr:ABC transporter permease [Betaproteobacteria bacterium]
MSLLHDAATGWLLATASLRARLAATLLTVALLAVGVALIIALLLVSRQLEAKSERDNAGIDLVVGAKGSPLQLILSSVYHVDIPTGNIPQADATRVAALPMVRRAVPLALGDSYRRFRIVGTDTGFDALYGLRVAAGTRAQRPMEAMLGAEVARTTGMAPGARFAGNHGLSDSAAGHTEESFIVTGVFAPTGSVADRLIVTPLDSVWHLHPSKVPPAGREPHAHGDANHDDADQDAAQRKITALLIQYASPLAAARLPREINAGSALQAASPAAEMTRLFGFLGIGIDTLRALAALIVVLASLGVFSALSAAMAERRGDLQLLRVLGAPRGVVCVSVLAQGAVIGLAGVILGLLSGHLAVEALGAGLARPQGIGLGGWTWAADEAWVVLVALAMALGASLMPAWRAYRTNLSAGLAEL